MSETVSNSVSTTVSITPMRLCTWNIDQAGLVGLRGLTAEVLPDVVILTEMARGSQVLTVEPWSAELVEPLPPADTDDVVAYWVSGPIAFSVITVRRGSGDALANAAAAWKGQLDGPIVVAGDIAHDAAAPTLANWDLVPAHISRSLFVPSIWTTTAWLADMTEISSGRRALVADVA